MNSPKKVSKKVDLIFTYGYEMEYELIERKKSISKNISRGELVGKKLLWLKVRMKEAKINGQVVENLDTNILILDSKKIKRRKVVEREGYPQQIYFMDTAIPVKDILDVSIPGSVEDIENLSHCLALSSLREQKKLNKPSRELRITIEGLEYYQRDNPRSAADGREIKEREKLPEKYPWGLNIGGWGGGLGFDPEMEKYSYSGYNDKGEKKKSLSLRKEDLNKIKFANISAEEREELRKLAVLNKEVKRVERKREIDVNNVDSFLQRLQEYREAPEGSFKAEIRDLKNPFYNPAYARSQEYFFSIKKDFKAIKNNKGWFNLGLTDTFQIEAALFNGFTLKEAEKEKNIKDGKYKGFFVWEYTKKDIDEDKVVVGQTLVTYNNEKGKSQLFQQKTLLNVNEEETRLDLGEDEPKDNKIVIDETGNVIEGAEVTKEGDIKTSKEDNQKNSENSNNLSSNDNYSMLKKVGIGAAIVTGILLLYFLLIKKPGK